MAMIALERPVVDMGASLDELVEVANAQHSLAQEAGRRHLLHAMEAGEALTAARDLIARGGWERWLDEHFAASRKTARLYMRMAACRDMLEAADIDSISEAATLIAGAQSPREQRKAHGVDLLERGWSINDVASFLDVDRTTVQSWRSPTRQAAIRRRNARARRTRALTEREERASAAKAAGGSAAEAYSLIRRALQQAQRAHDDASTREERAALTDCLHALQEAEYAIGSALRCG